MKQQRRGLNRHNLLRDSWRSLDYPTLPLEFEAKEDHQLLTARLIAESTCECHKSGAFPELSVQFLVWLCKMRLVDVRQGTVIGER